nr:flagellar hook-length control protein FliK [Cytobacillus eiseniae]
MEQFESILSRSKFSVNGGTQRLFIKLNPEHLGALRIELIQKDSMMVARILTSTSLAREMMESQLNGLKQAFSSQNIQIERVEISQQFTGQERTFNREQQQGQERQQPREEQKEQQANEHFTKSFEEALLNTEA